MTDKMTNSESLPRFPESYWADTASGLPNFESLQENIQTEVAVVGGGISGISTAYLLSKEGFKVVLLEAGKLMNGTTGHTTAKITAQHDLIYDELIKREGLEKASLYYKANEEALQFMKSTIHEHQIECGFSMQNAYVYASTLDYITKLEDEALAYRKIGIPGGFTESMPLQQLPAKAAVVMEQQAQFHPLKYLNHLIERFLETGGTIYEHTTAVNVEKDPDLPKVITSEGHSITCKYIVSCTHFPFYDGLGFYFARMHADRSYVLGVQVEDEYPGGMYLSAEDPKRSVRSVHTDGNARLLLIGGQSHKTGQGICTINHYESLQAFADKYFSIKNIAYRWSAQDLVTSDKLPYIGRITASAPNVFIATGYRKWGMTNSTAAALLIRDLILNRDSPYEQLYSPSRPLTAHMIKNLIADNADVAKHLIAGKLELVHKRPEDLGQDEGGVVKIHGKRAGAYRDKNGKLFIVDTTCTHMGCEVEWNDGERTWDCPCHGSRFSISGEVMEGPAEKPLRSL